jgi:hypothetical protein
MCTIKRNVRYQKEIKPWRIRYTESGEQRSYMQDYYAKNKLKFVEYRRTFKQKNPDYYKQYARRKKNEQL